MAADCQKRNMLRQYAIIIDSYTFDERYSLTGSIRIDQSNLFGTDPKYHIRNVRLEYV